MQPTELHHDKFLQILWNEKSQIIGIKWKATTASMTDENFKDELALFAAHVEQKKAPGILVDVCDFRHKMSPAVQEWRVKNISTRYNAAGVQRFAFLLPTGSQIPPMMNQSSAGEKFATRAFADFDSAVNWLTAGQIQHSAAD
jgi:hypothetical protein